MRFPPTTSTSSAQTDGQSCGQTEARRAMSRGAFIEAPVSELGGPSLAAQGGKANRARRSGRADGKRNRPTIRPCESYSTIRRIRPYYIDSLEPPSCAGFPRRQGQFNSVVR